MAAMATLRTLPPICGLRNETGIARVNARIVVTMSSPVRKAAAAAVPVWLVASLVLHAAGKGWLASAVIGGLVAAVCGCFIVIGLML